MVLHVRGVTGTGGGPEKTILNSPRFLRELGYRSICAYMHPPDDPGFCDLQRRAEQADAPLVSIADRGPLDWHVVRQLIDLCRSERVDIWHGHDYKSNAIGLLVRRFVPLRLVSTVHGWGVQGGRTKLYYRIDRFCLARYEQVYCVSENLREICLDHGVPESKCHLLPNAIDTEQFQRNRNPQEARGDFDQPSSGMLIGGLGRLSEEKGFDLLIRAVAQLIDEGHDISLWIGGEGPERARLTTLIERCGHGGRIRLLGHLDQPIDFMESLDLFVLSSRREGLPNVVLEAMAMKTPVVATRVAGVPSLISDRIQGLLVNTDNQDQLTDGIRSMLLDESLRKTCTAAARELIVNEYSFRRRMENLVQYYDRLLKREPQAIAIGGCS